MSGDIVESAPTGALVVRSAVSPSKNYGDYRQHLRHDFFYSCAYCTMSEAEAQAIRFVIDHYEPAVERPDLEFEYYNLMYCCDMCNALKGDRSPPLAARDAGHRFFRPDEDLYDDHFARVGLRLNPKTNTGEYSIEALDLNRHALRKLRELRGRLSKCEQEVTAGVLALKKVKLDQLPPNVRGQVLKAVKDTAGVAEDFAMRIDSVLRSRAKSELVDKVDDEETKSKRADYLRKVESLYPGCWRGREKTNSI